MGKKPETIPGYKEAVQALLPKGRLCEEESVCLLCADGKKRPTAWYAFVDMGHVREEAQGPALVQKDGKKAFAVPLQVPCCEHCKKNWARVNRILPGCTIAGLAAATVFGAVLPVRNEIAKVHTALPFALAAVCVAAGILIGCVWKKHTVKKLSAHTDFSWENIPYIGEMRKRGWFFLSEKRPARPVFSKEKRAETDEF